MLRRTKLSMSLLVAFGGALASTVVQAQQQLERVEITGSSIRRIEAEGALPVTVIKVEELTRLGVTTAEQAMQRIAANQSNFGVNAGVGGVTGGKSEADLRGLSGPTATNANKTLVLLNGRRLANHAFDAAAVDLNAIPLAAVERIEVLRQRLHHLRHRRHRRRHQLHPPARLQGLRAHRRAAAAARGRQRRHQALWSDGRLGQPRRGPLQHHGHDRLPQAEHAAVGGP